MSEFALNDAATVTITHIGRSGFPVYRIEEVLRDPAGVAAVGCAESFCLDGSNFYPGIRAPLPGDFSCALRTGLGRALQREFHRDTSYFSVVTTASADLLPIQRIPHYDSTDPGLLAAVIYLCDSRFCGTSFYRHRRTGYEEITADRRKNYQIALETDLRVHGPPSAAYVNGDTVLFERIYSNELRFNSAIVYPGRVLHAGDIPPEFVPPRSKDEWRLTITSLLFSG